MFEFGIYSNNGYPEIPDICPDNPDVVIPDCNSDSPKLCRDTIKISFWNSILGSHGFV